jgi:uncharacterized protein (TIGR04141 family)
MRANQDLVATVGKIAAATTIAKKDRKEKLSIYLLRECPDDDDTVINVEDSKPPVSIEIGRGKANLYVRKDFPHGAPPWTRFFSDHQTLPSDLFGSTSSVGAALVVRDLGKIFVLAFGTGHHLINKDMVERDFGLRVTLNSVDPDKLRSLDKASYDDNPLNSRIQSTREVDIFQLQIDSESELVHAVTGASSVLLFGAHITGKDALTILSNSTIDALPAILEEALNRYVMRLPAKFDWMDNIHRVKDRDEIEILDFELDTLIDAKDFTNMYLGEPEIVDWESQIGYAFDLRSNSPRHPVLELKDIQAHFSGHNETLSTTALKHAHVYIIDNEQRPTRTWPAYRCFYAEVAYDGKHYVLRNGLWYKIETNYVATVDAALANLNIWANALPIYCHDREEDYNQHVASTDAAFALMDKTFVQIGGPLDKLEFCDLIHGTGEFIHVKYYRSSATLSHLFSQGVVAAHALLGDEEFRVKLNDKLPTHVRFADPTLKPDRTGFQIVFAIATLKNLPTELPFFSKISLKQAVRSLETLGVKVAIAKIEVDVDVYKRKLYKPKASKN